MLVLMRHGKSAYPDGVADHDRPLAGRGRREAALAGDWLRAELPTIDAVLCSSSERTRQTLERTAIDAPAAYEPRIYDAPSERIISLIQLTDDAVATLLVVGHVPGMPYTAWDLASNRHSIEAAQLSRKFPTSALAVLEFDTSWIELDEGQAELTHFHIPR